MKIGDVSSAQLCKKLSLAGLGIQFGPYEFHIRSACPEVARGFQVLHAHRECRPAVRVPDFRIDLEPGLDRGRRCLTCSVDGQIWHVWPRRLSVAGLEWITSWCFFKVATERLAVHAAAAAVPGTRDALIFPGLSGAGKSTLASSLMMQGWTLLSDEISLFSLRDQHLVGLGRPTILKGNSLRLIGDAFPGRAVFGPRGRVVDPPISVAHLRPTEESVAASNVAFAPRAILLPRRSDDVTARPAVVPISEEQAFATLSQHGINYRVLGESAFRCAYELSRSVPAYEFHYHNALDAASFLQEADFEPSRIGALSDALDRPASSREQRIVATRSGGDFSVSGCDAPKARNLPISGQATEGGRVLRILGQINQLIESSDSAVDLSLDDWDQLIPFANHTQLLPQLANRILDSGCCGALHDRVVARLQTEQQRNRFSDMTLSVELEELERLLTPQASPLILLKGSAYFKAGCSWARGRRSSDVDLLVDESSLEHVTQRLLENGYAFDETLSSQDRTYYRKWLHELPPVKHAYRRMEIDIHFRLLPFADPKTFSVNEMIGRSVPLSGTPFYWLDPVDRVIHCCINLAHTGEFRRALRDLWDVRNLISDGEGAFDWDVLGRRVEALRLQADVAAVLLLANELVSLQIPEGWIEVDLGVSKQRLRRGRVYRTMRRAALPSGVAFRSTSRRVALWAMEHHPLPRLATWLDPLTWTKRVKFIQGK